MSEPQGKSGAPFDPDNFNFTLGDFTYQMDAGQLFTANKGVRTEHYAFEYTGPPLYALARAWMRHLDYEARKKEAYEKQLAEINTRYPGNLARSKPPCP